MSLSTREIPKQGITQQITISPEIQQLYRDCCRCDVLIVNQEEAGILGDDIN